MIASNIFRLIGDFFTWAFGPFEALRLESSNWWTANTINWLFLACFTSIIWILDERKLTFQKRRNRRFCKINFYFGKQKQTKTF